MRGDRDTFRDRADLLAHYIDALEDAIRQDLAALNLPNVEFGIDPRLTQRQLRHLDLVTALEAVAPARAELERCPEGAELAFRVLSIVLSRLRPAAELADLHYKAARKGGSANREKQQRAAARKRAKLQRAAAKLSPTLSTSAKAKILAKTSSLSESRIRHIIAK